MKFGCVFAALAAALTLALAGSAVGSNVGGGSGGSSTPGGSANQVEYNANNVFGGVGGVTVANGLNFVQNNTALFSQMGATVDNWGDSVTNCSGGGCDNTSGYAYLIDYDNGGAFNNHGRGGEMVCDNLDATNSDGPFNQSAATQSKPILNTVNFGINDADQKGAGTYEAVYKGCLQADVIWLATPSNFETAAQACSSTGTWANDSLAGGTVGRHSTTNASTLACNITVSGGVVYIIYGATGALLAVRISGISNGAHTININVTSATGAGNLVDIWMVSTVPSVAYTSTSSVLVTGVIKQQNDTKSAATAAYDSDSSTVANQLQSDGLPVYWINVRNYVNSTSDMFNTLHPTSTGQEHLREAIEAVAEIPRLELPKQVVGSNGVNPPIYYSFNPNNLAGDTTNLAGGFSIYGCASGCSNNWYGVDLGDKSSFPNGFFTRVFAQSGNICFASVSQTAGPSLVQSSFTNEACADSSGLNVPSGNQYRFNGDTGLSRDAADVIDCGNGSNGNKSCTFNLTTEGLQGVTVASLPASPIAGMVAYVTDANAACTAGSTVAGGGSTKCFVGYNGAAWKDFGI